MSDHLYKEKLNTFMKRLRDQAQVERNDVRHRQYVEYINEFISHFGKEKVYLVGSTGEILKLRWSKDYGDADFIVCSGLFEIPVDNLVIRKDTPCFVWVKADGLESKINFELIDGKYIPTHLLKNLSPELFTFVRAIYLIVTSTLDTIAGRQSRVTTTALSSRVGLARTEYRNLKISDDRITDPKRRKRFPKRRTTNRRQTIKNFVINKKDKEMIDTIFDIVVLAKKPNSSGSGDGQFQNFAHMMHLLQKRRNFGSETTQVKGEMGAEGGVIYVNDLDEESDNVTLSDDSRGKSVLKHGSTSGHGTLEFGSKFSGIDATYEEKSTKDFVAAVRVNGQLPAMVAWKNRGGFWPRTDDRVRISNSEVFIVSRYAPLSPDMDKDFCLSFNQAELELARCMSDVQRDVFLILKSYLKGGFQTTYDKKKQTSELKLKTFHLKTAFYWVSEMEDPCLWQKHNAMDAVLKVLKFIIDAVDITRLVHYFIPENNLFADLEKEDADIIRECVCEAMADPVNYIQHFFNLDDGEPVTLKLTEDELETIVEMQNDGGIGQTVDAIEEAVIDIHRGLNEGPRDASGNAPLIDAIQTTFDKFLEDVNHGETYDWQEKKLIDIKSKVTTLLGALRLSQATNTTGMIAGIFGSLLGSQTSQVVNTDPTSERTYTQQKSTENITVHTTSTQHTDTQDEQPGTSRQTTHCSSSHRDEGRQLLAGVLNFFANRKNMDREGKRKAEDDLKRMGKAFFPGKPW